MLRITRQADYGIVLMSLFLQKGAPEIQTARDLAEKSRLPQPTVTKILKRLARRKVLTSQRGVKGGYRLGRPAQEIDLAEIISALEGDIALTQCSEHGIGCEHEPHCPVKGKWQRIDRAVRQALADVSLAEMVDSAAEGVGSSGLSFGSRVQSAVVPGGGESTVEGAQTEKIPAGAGTTSENAARGFSTAFYRAERRDA